ncbi:DNA/RNA nuclease SfsA [Paraferrimonas sp. SM1919]|uniref:DNA/RNA nuclease SfsA n=1 Tax=Paraferrimonas sp. SM1919 TaxID=2662263 RepID=UPI0013D114C4|nr:DNA/RNA nuclease SfsA [Paraferrimonas sp. SM1919]
MNYQPPLVPAILIKRYKRFLADVRFSDGSQATIHCPNTGAMTNCLFAGETIWCSPSNNPQRKTKFTWQLTRTPHQDWISVNSQFANQLAIEAIQNGVAKELQGYENLKTEVRYGEENSRIDILLSSDSGKNCFVEVKSVTLLREQGQGWFPDAVSTRAQKHIRELINIVQQGHRGVLMFVAQHTGIDIVSVAVDIDPAYGQLLKQALDAGVEVLAYGCSITENAITINKKVDFNCDNLL